VVIYVQDYKHENACVVLMKMLMLALTLSPFAFDCSMQVSCLYFKPVCIVCLCFLI